MNLSNLSKSVIQNIANTQSNMFFKRLSPLQILIMTISRELENDIEKRMRGKKKQKTTDMVFADQVRKKIHSLYTNANEEPYTSQGFWVAINSLKKQGLIYSAPYKKNSTKRIVCLTVAGNDIFSYPPSIRLYT